MCDKCRRKEFQMLALALANAMPQEPDPDEELSPVHLASMFLAAAASGQIEILALLTATVPLDEQVRAMAVLNGWSDQLGQLRDDMGGAIGTRLAETGETPPEGVEVLDMNNLAELGLDPAILDKLRAGGSVTVDASQAPARRTIPADDNPELLARIFRDAKPRKGRKGDTGPVS